jgi:hypothetical protein
MPVQILLDQPPTVWTNLDQIKGKVVLRLDSQSSITSIVVKLEGESKTKLVTQGALTAQPDLGERPRAYEEFHKVGRSLIESQEAGKKLDRGNIIQQLN